MDVIVGVFVRMCVYVCMRCVWAQVSLVSPLLAFISGVEEVYINFIYES